MSGDDAPTAGGDTTVVVETPAADAPAADAPAADAPAVTVEETAPAAEGEAAPAN